MKISVLNVEVSTKTTKTGKPYQNAEVAYKNLDTGKVESKSIFGWTDVFKHVVEMTKGKVYEVVSKKSDSGYWDWISVTESTGEAMPASRASPAPRSNFETPEERAARQVLIVKQSSLSSAIEYLKSGTKAPPSVEQVLLIAQQFTDWVFNSESADVFNLPNDEPEVQ